MALEIKAVRGTQDVLPSQSYKWRYLEGELAKAISLYGYKEIRVPTLEATELFARTSGETSDVVSKEMYTFNDNGGRSVTLRPEGTAGVVRAVLENGLLNQPMPLKLWYIVSSFRYGRPQTGRLREFHQFGAELLGVAGYAADAELISMAAGLLAGLGLKNVDLEINSIGCKACRGSYHDALKAYFTGYADQLCPTCLTRLDKNPMRILDCKSELCQQIGQNAPKTIDYLCLDCKDHFDGLKKTLDSLGIAYTVNPSVVRGLDYYNRTVFEFLSDTLGPRLAVLAGGRYDGLVEELGGAPTPGLGFGSGLERIVLMLDKIGYPFPADVGVELYIVPMGDEAALQAASIAAQLRRAGIAVLVEQTGRGLKAAMKYANNSGARYALILGEQELTSGRWVLRNMQQSSQEEISSAGDLLKIFGKA